MLEKINVYFRTPVALHIPKFIAKKKTFFLEGIEKCFPKQKSHIEFLKTSRDSFSVMWRDLSIISVALESYDIALSINISHMPDPSIPQLTTTKKR